MDTVYIDDKTVTLMDDRDIEEILNERVSSDFSRYIMERIAYVDSERIYAEQLAMTDAQADEECAELYRNLLSELMESIDDMVERLSNSKRWNKDKILADMASMSDSINRQL